MKIYKIILIFSFLIIIGFFIYFFVGAAPQAKKIIWGVNFSQKQAENLKLDWQKTYLALLNDLNAKQIKIAVHWDKIEPETEQYYFDDLDWQIEQARNYQAKILLVIGRKTPRWPECHIPDWAKNWTEQQQQEQILKLLKKIVSRYKNEETIWAWQVENEPFFSFGQCPKTDKNFLKKEINFVKFLDIKKRPIIISDSGEATTWFQSASLADIVGITIYRKSYNKFFNVIDYPFTPVFYWRKTQLIKNIFKKEVICVELQLEPWGKELLYNLSLEEQKQTMDLEQFKKNIEFAKKTGLKEFYFWGAEWWYWLKTIHQDETIWQEAKKLFY